MIHPASRSWVVAPCAIIALKPRFVQAFSVRPFDRNNSPPLGIAFAAAEPRGQVGDAFVWPETEGGQRRRVDQPAMPAPTFNDDEIARSEILDPGRIQRGPRSHLCPGYRATPANSIALAATASRSRRSRPVISMLPSWVNWRRRAFPSAMSSSRVR